MTDPHRDFSCSSSSSINLIPSHNNKKVDIESSLDSYENIFDKDQNNFTTSTIISTINLDNEPLDQILIEHLQKKFQEQ